MFVHDGIDHFALNEIAPVAFADEDQIIRSLGNVRIVFYILNDAEIVFDRYELQILPPDAQCVVP